MVKMPRPKGPSPEAVKRIYAVLVKGPKCFEDIWKETGLHRNTVGSTLGYLVQKNMLKRYREGHKKMYEMKKTQPPYYGWEIPWIELMMTKREKEMHYKRVEEEVRKFWFQKELDGRVKQFRTAIYEKLVKPPCNQELIKVLEEIGIKVTPRILLENLKVPFCLECLKKEKKFVKAEFKKETGEFCCPKCGLVLQKESFSKQSKTT